MVFVSIRTRRCSWSIRSVDEATSFEDMVDLIASKKAKNAGAVSVVALGEANPLSENFYPLLRF